MSAARASESNTRPCANCASGDYLACYEVPTPAGERYHIVRCRNCALVRLRESMTEEQYLELYDGSTSTVHVADQLTFRTYDRILASLDEFKQSGKFLEIGIGGGSFIRRAAERGWSCFGNDVSNVAFDALYDLVPPANLHRGQLDQAPFFASLAPVDVCVMLGVLEHIPAPVDLLGLVHKVVRPGGALFIDVPNYGALSRRVLGAKWGMWDVPDHVSFFTPSTLAEVIGKAGFTVRRAWTSGFNPVDLGRLFASAAPSSGAIAPNGGGNGATKGSGASVYSDRHAAERATRRKRIDRIRRVLSHLGPTKAILDRGLNAFSGGDTLYCLAVAPH